MKDIKSFKTFLMNGQTNKKKKEEKKISLCRVVVLA